MASPSFTARAAGPGDTDTVCAICQTAIRADESIGYCPDCDSPFHDACWGELGGCATYGCPRVPEQRADPDPAPRGFWGQDEKSCPHCGSRAKMAALRCRNCGHLYPAPDHSPDAARGPSPQAAVVLFIAGLLPFTAPFAFLIGAPWLFSHRHRLGLGAPVAGQARTPRWSPVVRILAILGLCCAATTTVLLALIILLHPGGCWGNGS